MKIYLCSPYSHPDEAIREARFESANRMAAELMLEGHTVFSPISHSHPIAKYVGNPNDSNFWLKQDRAFISWCDAVIINGINGWNDSHGIRKEIRWARELGKPVSWRKP